MSGSPTATTACTVAAFDFDGTLLNGDCLLILHSLVRSPVGRMIDGVRLLPALLLWKSGLRCTAWFKQLFLQVLLTPVMQSRSAQQRKHFLQHILAHALWQRLRPEALSRLAWHRQQGHRLVIVSASPRCLLQPIAERLELELIATETTDPCTGAPIELRSPNCKGLEKIHRLSHWLQCPLHNVELHAYGDSKGDRELLQSAAEPHWRSFQAAARPYPAKKGLTLWFTPLAVVLLISAIGALLRLDPATQTTLISALMRLSGWLPAIVAVLAVSYAGRYWRFRLLLRAEGIGRCSSREAFVWFQGFALTATPGKLGELSRVQQLHQQLGYSRTPLFHVFLAERLCDAAAVVIWLALLVPGQLQQRFLSLNSAAVVATGLSVFLIFSLGCWFLRRRLVLGWIKHLPSGCLARACLPASCISVFVWGLEAMLLWLLVQVVSSATSISVGEAISIYLLSGTAGMASLLPGGLGVNEATTTLLLHQTGVPISLALSIAILRRLCTVWLIVMLSITSTAIPKKAFFRE